MDAAVMNRGEGSRSIGQRDQLNDSRQTSPIQDADLFERNGNLEFLIWAMWERLDAGTTGTDDNLRSWYDESVPHGPQTPMPSHRESQLGLRVRVLENLARQLWGELDGRPRTPRNELQGRVHARLEAFISRLAEPAPSNLTTIAPSLLQHRENSGPTYMEMLQMSIFIVPSSLYPKL